MSLVSGVFSRLGNLDGKHSVAFGYLRERQSGKEELEEKTVKDSAGNS